MESFEECEESIGDGIILPIGNGEKCRHIKGQIEHNDLTTWGFVLVSLARLFSVVCVVFWRHFFMGGVA
jgi:hypothetical protein